MHLLEEVGNGEARREVGVQVVVNHFGAANFAPLVVWQQLVELALRVRLAERVKVFELAPRDEQIHLHAELCHTALSRL